MRRGWLRIVLAAAILAAGLALALVLLARAAPERLRSHLEARLAADLGRPVRIGALRVDPAGAGLTVSLARVRVGAAGDALRLRIPEAEAGIDALALLGGRVRVGRLVLDRPRLRVVGTPEAGAADGTGAAGLPRLLDAAGDHSLPFRWLEVRGGRVTWLRPGAPPLEVDAVAGHLDARRLRRGRAVTLRARLAVGDGVPLVLDLEESGGRVLATAGAEGLRLEDLARLDPRLDRAAARGRVDLRIEWRREEGGGSHTLLLASGEDVALRPVGAGGPRVALDRPRLRAELARSPRGWELSFAELADGALRLRARGRLGGGADGRSPLSLHLETADLALRGPGSLLARTPRAWREPLEAALAPVERARLVDASVELRVQPARLHALLAGEAPRPGELRLALEVADATVRAGEDDRLEEVAGGLAWDGDRLEVRDLRARYRGHPLPRLDLAVRGLSHVHGLGELRCIEPAPAPALHGLPRLVAWLDAQPHDVDGEPAFEGVSLRADWLAHPTLVCSVEQLAARVVPAPGGLDLEVERAVFAGLPLEGEGAWRGPDAAAGREASLTLALEVGPPFEPMTPNPPRTPWARGRFRAGLRRLGPWRLSGADGAFAITGSSLTLRDVALGLVPAGPVRTTATLDLGSRDALPYRAAFAIEELEAAQVARAGGIARPALSGSLHGAGAVRGHLVPGRSPLDEATGTLTLHAREGRVHRRLPPLLAIATASGSLNPFDGDAELPFQAVDMAAVLEGGRLRSEHFALVGPTVRMAARGSVAVARPHDVEATVGMFLFPGLDALLDRLPLLNHVLLGPNGNLVGAYLALDGPFEAPHARLVPIRSIATGPASLVFERVPGLLFGGFRMLRGAIAPPAAEEPEAGSAASTADS